MPGGSYISRAKLVPSASRIKRDEPVTLEVRFRIDGRIRESFNQRTWTEAYNKHDNLFMVKYTIRVQTGSVRGREVVKPVRFVRKAAFYWSRNPKLQPRPPSKKIWVMIVTDDLPTLPDSVEDAKSLIFDVRRSIELIGSTIGRGRRKLFAHVTASWGRHLFTEPLEIESRSKEVEIVCE